MAQDNNKIVGAVLCGHDGRRGYLRHLTVKKESRQNGLGRKLVQHCLQGLAETGINKCHLFVFADNSKGQSFWKNVGW